MDTSDDEKINEDTAGTDIDAMGRGGESKSQSCVASACIYLLTVQSYVRTYVYLLAKYLSYIYTYVPNITIYIHT